MDPPPVPALSVSGRPDLAHDHGVPELIQALPERGGVQRGQADGAHDLHAVVIRHAGVDVGVLEIVPVQAVQQFAAELLAEHRRTEAIQDQQHAHATGVHHVRGLQGIKLALRADHSL